ncbi:MAG: class I SAM-dependent methyltransferase [Elusimicrobiota bacterium]|jgi:SAM-dependent methyltransferase
MYRSDAPFPVYSARQLKDRYERYGLDPRSTHPWLFDQESLSSFGQSGVLELFRGLRIRPEHRVLSLGEGHGAPSRLLVKTVGCRVTGVDVVPRQVACARELARFIGLSGRLEYLCQDVHDLDLGRRRFDRLYANDTMCHWSDKAAALKGAARYLAPGALAGAHDWLLGDEGDLELAARRLPQMRGTFQRGVFFQETLVGMARAFEAAGFEVLEASDLTRAIDRVMRRRLAALRRLEKSLAPGDHRWIAYFKGMVRAHFRFFRYGRVIARLSAPSRSSR